MGVETLGGAALLHLDISAAGVPGEKYIRDLVINTDFQKFDETLRMVMDSSPEQTKGLLTYLDGEHRRRRLCYGAHTGKEALITCLIFDRQDKHLYFIDGASGGYALAAEQMKHQERLSDAAL
jgi:hypothetical protein